MIVKGDLVLAVHPVFGTVEGTFIGWGIQDDGTRYVALIDAKGRQRDIPLRPDCEPGGFEFHLLSRG